jgi:rhomboid protease GluP
MSKSSKEYMPTYILIAANVGVYAFTSVLSGNLYTSDDVINAFGQVNLYVWNGQVWRLFTAMFIHADPLHIFGNMLFLFIFGLRAEDMFDIKEYLMIYFLSGLSGGFLTLILWPPDVASIGASGAIFGMLAATIVYLSMRSRRSIGQSLMTALIYVLFFFFINSVGPGVNYLAHLGGLATGLFIGYVLAISRGSNPRGRL